MRGVLDRLPKSVLDDLKRRYAEPQRHYHVWRHVEALLSWAVDREADLENRDAVILAILFHDAVYDPARVDNESASARLLETADVGDLSEASRLRAVRMIEATAKHLVPEGLGSGEHSDMCQFLDMDLSILGAPAEIFDLYEAAVRSEYDFVPIELFRAGRKRILETFQDRPELYFSPWGRSMFETQARANLTRSIEALSR